MIRKPKGFGEYVAMLAIWVGLLVLFGALSQRFRVLVIATLEAGLVQVGASEPAKRVITGLVIVVAVILDAWRYGIAGTPFPLRRRFFMPNRS